MRLYVEAPGAGELSAAADGAVQVNAAPVRVAGKRRHASGKHQHASAGRTSKDGEHARIERAASPAHPHATPRVAERQVASTSQKVVASTGGLAQLTLTLTSSYRALATRHGGLSATVNVSFSAPGQKKLTQSLVVTFLSTVKRSAGKRSKKLSAAKQSKSSRTAKRATVPAGRGR